MLIYNDTDPNNIENVTLEIIEEADEHQVFYAITDELSGFSIASASNDTNDSDGNPLFIKTTWTTTGETSRGCGRISYSYFNFKNRLYQK